MKVTFLVMNPHGLAGGDRVIALYAAYLRKRGHEVRLVAPAPKRHSVVERFRRVRHGLGWSDRRENIESQFVAMDLRVETLDRHRPIESWDVPDGDAVIATWWETAEWAERLPRSKGRGFHLVQDYEKFPHLDQDRVEAVYQGPLEKIVVSHWLFDFFRREYPAAVVRLVPNGVDTDRFRFVSRNRSCSLRVGFMHSGAARKNSSLAVESLKRAKREGHVGSVTVMSRNALDRFDLPKDWETYVRPPQLEIPAIYARCDLWLFTSRTEGFGLPLLEAMSCGTPVLATRAGAAPEIVAEGGGRLLESSPKAFADAMGEVAGMPNGAWRALSAQARRTAIGHRWERSFALFETVLTGDAPAETVR